MTRTATLCARVLLAVLALALIASQPAQAKRIALVIGNDSYESVPKLQKARNDARAMAQALAKLGFEVSSAEDAGRRAMSRAIVELENKIQKGDTALFFFAGHGFAVEGTNYLLPVDVPTMGAGEEGLVRDASFSAPVLADRLREKGAATAIMILDACRDYPFPAATKRSGATTRGLARMDPAEGMFVLFSAGAGQAALDSLSSNDNHPNSVFTRTFLAELDKPDLSMVQIAKRTQSEVRKLTLKMGHEQTPAYYDQIIGELYLTPDGKAGKGSVQAVIEGGGTGVLPDMPQQPQNRVASLPTGPQPIASFTRSNSGWTVSVSLPEPATQFGYRVGEQGNFRDAGQMDVLDQKTGQRAPKTYFELPPDQKPIMIYVTWRDRRGEQADVFPIRFDPLASIVDSQKQILDQGWTSWIAFREFNGMNVYFTHLVSYRCAIREVRYGYNDAPADKVWKLPACDMADPHAVPYEATLHMKVPPKTASMSVRLTYADGTQSELRRFNAPK